MANVSEKLRTGEESDPITDIQKFQSQLLDRIIKIEKELKLLYKPYFVDIGSLEFLGSEIFDSMSLLLVVD